MKEHKATFAVLSVLMLVGAGCSHHDQPTARQHKPLWKPGDNHSAASAKEAPQPKILPDTHFAAGRLFERQGLAEKAIQQYRKAIAVNHTYGDAHHRLGVLLSATGRHEEALPMLRRAAVLKPGSAVVHNDLGFELMFHQAWSEAEQEFRRSVQLMSRYPRAHVNLGLALSQQGRFDEALAAFREVLPEPDAHYNLALLLRGQQRYAQAVEALHTVLRIDPKFRAAQAQLDQIMPLLETERTVVGPTHERGTPMPVEHSTVAQGLPAPQFETVDQVPALLAVAVAAPRAPGSAVPDEPISYSSLDAALVVNVTPSASWLDESWVGPVSFMLAPEPPCFDEDEVIVERRELVGAPIGYNTFMQPIIPDSEGYMTRGGSPARPTAASSIVGEPSVDPPAPPHDYVPRGALPGEPGVSVSPEARRFGTTGAHDSAAPRRSTMSSTIAPQGGGKFMSPVGRPVHRTVFAGGIDSVWDGASFAPSVATNPRAWLQTIDDYHNALSVVRNEIACWEEKVDQQVWFEEAGLNYSPIDGY